MDPTHGPVGHARRARRRSKGRARRARRRGRVSLVMPVSFQISIYLLVFTV
jgi:hypothetical protein